MCEAIVIVAVLLGIGKLAESGELVSFVGTFGSFSLLLYMLGTGVSPWLVALAAVGLFVLVIVLHFAALIFGITR
jgi:hypothetical protein